MEVVETFDEEFSLTARQSELLKAPTRKRKPDSERCIKRVVRMTWDVESSRTDALLDDLGVSLMDAESLDMADKVAPHRQYKPTPEVQALRAERVPPGAPKVPVHIPTIKSRAADGSFGHHHGPQSLAHVREAVPFIEPQGTTDGVFFIARRFRSDQKVVQGCNHWEQLSDEIILSVFKWLPKSVLMKCARVCKRWNRLCFDETLWRRLDLNNKLLKKGVLGRVLQRGVAVLRLAKTEIRTPLFTEPCSVFNKQQFSKVQYLDLSMAVISTEGLESLMSTCHLLRKLSLENCTINDQICRCIGQNINLEVLNLCMCQGLTENGLVPICNNLKRLDALNVAWTNMSRGAVLYLVICLSPSVTKLNLSGCRETLLDEDVQQLCNSCPGLKELDLSDATLITGQAVEHISNSLSALEYIALSRCYQVMPSSLPLFANVPPLLALDVFGMLRESIMVLLKQKLPSIEINKFPFSSIARPTTGIRRTSIWGLRVRDIVV